MFNVGDEVVAKLYADYSKTLTEENHSYIRHMRDIAENRTVITITSVGGYRDSVDAGGWTWSPVDLEHYIVDLENE